MATAKKVTAVKQKVAAKPVAVKPATAKVKSAAKPKPVAKPVAKKMKATTKPAVKPTTTAKTATSKEITLHGSKLIKSLRYEFTSLFPYIELELWDTVANKWVRETKISEIGIKNNKDTLVASGRMLVKKFKSEVEKTFGVRAAFFYYKSREAGAAYNSLLPGHDNTSPLNNKTLSQLNEHAKSIGAVEINKNDVFNRRFR